MNAMLAAVLVGTAIFVVIPREVEIPVAEPTRPETSEGTVTRNRVLGASVLAGLAVWFIAGGGVVSAALGVGTGLIAARALFRFVGRQQIDPVILQRQAAEACELMAACLAAGATLGRTTYEVGRALEEPIATMLFEADALMAMGAAVEVAWQGFADHEPTAPIARAVVRSAASGAPSAEALLQVAADLRDRRHADAQTRVRSVAVAAVGPLGLCFLPAFLLLGVVPIVVVLIDSGGR